METRKPSKPHLSVKTTVWMMMPILALASWLIPCCSVSGKPEQTGLQVWDPRGKKKALYLRGGMQTHPAISCFIVCWLGAMVEWPPHLFQEADAWVSLFLLPCLESTHICFTLWVGFPWVHPCCNLPAWHFVHMLYLPLINAKKNNNGLCISLWIGPAILFNWAFAIRGDVIYLKSEFSFTSQH